MSEEKVSLLPCPFCGSPGDLRDYGAQVFRVECKSARCPAFPTTLKGERDLVIEAWNRRALSQDRSSRTEEVLQGITGLIGNVDHSAGGGENTARLYGGMLNDIRTLALSALEPAAPVGVNADLWDIETTADEIARDIAKIDGGRIHADWYSLAKQGALAALKCAQQQCRDEVAAPVGVRVTEEMLHTAAGKVRSVCNRFDHAQQTETDLDGWYRAQAYSILTAALSSLQPSEPVVVHPAAAYQDAEELLCNCGAAGSGLGHASFCAWLESEWKRWGDAYERESAASPPAPEPSEKGVEGWQDIATAPKDGTPVDLWHAEYGRLTEVWWDVDDAFWVTGAPDQNRITHWHAITAPTLTSRDREG